MQNRKQFRIRKIEKHSVRNAATFSLYGEIGSFKKRVKVWFLEQVPFAHRGYPVKVRYKEMVGKEVTRLVSREILEEVSKGDGQSTRLCLDLRELNGYQKLEPYCGLHLDSLLWYFVR